MKEINKAENDLKAERVDAKLYLSDGPLNHLLTLDDALEEQGVHSLQPSVLCLKQAWSPFLGAIENHGFDNCLHEIEFC